MHPNFITSVRLVCAPLAALFLLYGSHFLHPVTAIVLTFFLWGVGELSDVLDGYYARRQKCVSDFGKLYDPFCDSVFRLTFFFCFTATEVQLPLWLPLCMLYRDLFVAFMRARCALAGYAFAAVASGKYKALVQAMSTAAILFLIFLYRIEEIRTTWLVWGAWYCALPVTVMMLFSGVDYWNKGRKHFS